MISREFPDQYNYMDEKSRTQKKKEARALRVLGEKLVKLTDQQLKGIGIPQELVEAVQFAKTITRHGARKRQSQLIGSIMRGIDPEPIRKGLEKIALNSRRQTIEHQQIETWRDEFIAGDNDQIETFIKNYPDADRQKLKQLVRNARKEATRNLPPKSSRALFRYLKELMAS